MASRKKPAAKYHHGDLRAAIVATAWEVVAKKGVDSLSLRAVADALGVSHAAPAHHFPDKESLREALCAEAWRRFADALELAPALIAARSLSHAARIFMRAIFRRNPARDQAGRAGSGGGIRTLAGREFFREVASALWTIISSPTFSGVKRPTSLPALSSTGSAGQSLSCMIAKARSKAID